MPLSEFTRIRDSAERLLPPNSTPLERAMVSVSPFDSVLRQAGTYIPYLGTTQRITEWLPWLLVGEGMTSLSIVQADANVLLDNAYWLNRHKGTPAALLMVAGWAGFTPEIWEHTWESIHFGEFQFELDVLPVEDMTVICRLWEAINYVKPLRSRFRRAYYGHDRRKLVLSVKQGKETNRFGSLLSDFSGVDCRDVGYCPVVPGGKQPRFKTSFRRTHSAYAVGGIVASLSGEHTRTYDPAW